MTKPKKSKVIIAWIGIFIGFLALIFILQLFGLGMFSFFAPKMENVKRNVFENTKSYTHGVIQDLGKYYAEYQTANDEEKQTIKFVIQNRFAEFDANKIKNIKLRNFFTNMRGY